MRRHIATLTGKRLHHVVFGFFVIVRMVFDVQLVADGELIFQVLYRSDAAQTALHHDGQTGAQSFAFFETLWKKTEKKNIVLNESREFHSLQTTVNFDNYIIIFCE